jgi:hypothetical protein
VRIRRAHTRLALHPRTASTCEITIHVELVAHNVELTQEQMS